MKKHIIFFDANLSVLPAIRYAKSCGYHVIACDNKAENPGHKEADESILISTYDTEAINDYIEKNPVDGVVYFASSHGCYAGAKIIEKYSLPGIAETIKDTLSYKNNFRQFLKNNGFTSFPNFILFNGTSIPKEIETLTFPVIVKPTDCGGNNGITKVCSQAELQAAVDYAHNVSKSGNIIIEEFIETDLQVNGDCVIEDGEVKLAFLGKHIYSQNSDILPYSTIFGEGTIPQDIRTQIDAEIKKLAAAIGIKSGVLNVEFRVSKSGKVYFIEVNTRHSGNFIYQLMNKAYDLSLEEIGVKLAVGEKLNLINTKPSGYFAYALIYAEENGIFDSIEFSDDLNKFLIKKLIFKKSGDTVNRFTRLFDRVGITLLQFPSFDTMQEVITNFRNYYKINLLKQ